MKHSEFRSMKRLKYDDDFRKLNIGDKFLMGENMILQTEKKKNGEEVSYYTVLRKEGNNIEYVLQFSNLEEDVI
jgi:hypothetical protein